jgi:DNA-binding NarL/FixJ family response regulator
MLCAECDKRNICTELCEAAEKYVNQDKPDYWHKRSEVHFTPMEKQIVTLVMKGKTRVQIRKTLKLSVGALRAHVKRLKKKRDQIAI